MDEPVESGPDEPIVEEAVAEQEQFVPAEVTMLNPGGISVEKLPDGSAHMEILVSPFKVIGFVIPAEAVVALVAKLTGGVEIARTMPAMAVPRGRGR